jgi:hypothetical protein
MMVLRTSDFLNLRTFAEMFVIHGLIQLDQGYRLHFSYSLNKRFNIKKINKKY